MIWPRESFEQDLFRTPVNLQPVSHFNNHTDFVVVSTSNSDHGDTTFSQFQSNDGKYRVLYSDEYGG